MAWLRNRLRRWPERLLALATLAVVAAVATVAWGIAGGDPWPSDLTERMGVVGVLVGVGGLMGVVLTLAAGVAEISQIFPRQSLFLQITLASRGSGATIWEIRVENGASFVQHARVEVLGLQKVPEGDQILAHQASVEWLQYGSTSVFAAAEPLFPHQISREGQLAGQPTSTTVEWDFVWWTDRSGPHRIRETIVDQHVMEMVRLGAGGVERDFRYQEPPLPTGTTG